MSFGYKKQIVALVLVTSLSSCGEVTLFGVNYGDLRAKDSGPDEFSVLPTKPLELPEDLEALPEPTPGSTNRADLTPDRDAVAALGGRPERLDATTVGGGEQALVTAASRFGVTAGIRDTLAADDEAFRSRNKARLLERWFKSNVYFKRYQSQTLDAYTELSRLRRLGVRTPTVPPKPE